MLLGVSTGFEHSSPEEWARKQVELGCKAVVFPINSKASDDEVKAYAKTAKDNNLCIAEVGVWVNTLSSDKEERINAINYAIDQLAMADSIGARCCVNIVGTAYGPQWDGAYKGNYSLDNRNDSVGMIRQIIDEVKPQNTVYSIEPMPWMIPSSPDEYLKLIEDVDRDEFGVHMDIINMINSPKRYLFMDEFIDECFDKLGDRIVSCHLKDVHFHPQFTMQLKEVKCGDGEFNLEKYVERANMADPNMPVLLEHLNSDEEYIESFKYVRKRLLGE